MQKLTHEQARELVEYELVAASGDSSHDHDKLIILDEKTIERPWGWVFFYDSLQHQESGDIKYLLIGNAPYLVNRNDGSIHSTGTSSPIENYIAEYESQLASGVSEPSPYPKRSLWSRLFGW